MIIDNALILPALISAGIQILLIAASLILLATLSGVILRRMAHWTGNVSLAERLATVQRSLRQLLTLLGMLLGLAALLWNGWLLYDGVDAWAYTVDNLRAVEPQFWYSLAQGIGLTLLYVVCAVISTRMIRRVLAAASKRSKGLGGLHDNDQAIERFFHGLSRALCNTLWLGVFILASINLQLPDAVLWVLFRVATIYLIIAVGLTLIRVTAVLVDTLDALSARYAEDKSWSSYYLHLRPLVPLLRRCLEYALWIGVATLSLAQLPALSTFAAYGPHLIQAIGIFFLARVAIELAHLVIDQVMLGDAELEAAERKRRLTIVPLIKSIGKYVIYFAAFVLILATIGFDPMPFLAGAGILGVVIGLGAQPLINDVVSGFFVLFENTFLVGDTIRAGDTYGTVESIDFRTTRIRDPDGNLHVLRNGDMRHVINYSKDYTHAVLELAVAHDADTEQALAILADCGSAVSNDARVQGPLQVRGITRIDAAGVHLRAVMPVTPGEHFPIAARLRLAAITALSQAGIPLLPNQRVSLLPNPPPSATINS